MKLYIYIFFSLPMKNIDKNINIFVQKENPNFLEDLALLKLDYSYNIQ